MPMIGTATNEHATVCEQPSVAFSEALNTSNSVLPEPQRRRRRTSRYSVAPCLRYWSPPEARRRHPRGHRRTRCRPRQSKVPSTEPVRRAPDSSLWQLPSAAGQTRRDADVCRAGRRRVLVEPIGLVGESALISGAPVLSPARLRSRLIGAAGRPPTFEQNDGVLLVFARNGVRVRHDATGRVRSGP